MILDNWGCDIQPKVKATKLIRWEKPRQDWPKLNINSSLTNESTGCECIIRSYIGDDLANFHPH